MKRFTISVATFLLLLTFSPVDLSAENGTASKPKNRTESPAMSTFINRLKEIKSMDRSNLESTEKQDLRNEVLDIKQNMKSANNGVYLSIGALILIVLLLILLL